MYGAMDWMKAGKKTGFRTIVGMEAYVAPEGRHERKKSPIHHLTLLARNETGYRNLLELASKASLEGFYYKPRIDYDLLAQKADGITCLSGCLSSHLASHILHDRNAAASQLIDDMSHWFGREHFFLEVMDHGMPEQQQMTRFLIAEGKRTGLPLVATNDVHFVRREDHPAHDILLCIQTGATVDDPNRFASKTDQIYMKSGDEMLERFHEIPEAVSNTLRVVEQCDLRLSNPGFLMPHFAVPDGFTADTYLEHLCREGAKRKYGHVEGEVAERLAFELKVITDMGFPTYFLVVWDFVRYAKERGVLVGPGRGSAAGSIVAYSLDITTVDPLQHGLLFERFLNPSRVSMPDIDIDFADDGRDLIIKYVTEKYGAEQVAQIITFGTLAARAAIRDVGRALGMPYGEVDLVSKMIPQVPAHPVSIGQALEQVPDLKALRDKDANVRRLLDTAQKLEGVSRHASTHAAGIVISRDPLIQHVPLQRTGTGDNAGVTTQYPMGWLEDLGLLKMDFLGLKTLTVLTKALQLLGRRGITVDLDALDLEDPAAYAPLMRGETMGIFQLDQPTGQRICALVKPRNFAELVAVGALARPGPMEHAPRFAARKEGREEVTYAHPDLEPVLRETYGFALFQEQVMQIARVLADYSLAEADSLRKAMGKKLPAEMAKHRDRFVQGCAKKGVPKKTAEPLFEELEKFSGYGFNKAHSTCYGLVGYWCAYLKAHHPAEFLAAILTSEQGDTARVVQLIAECRRMKIAVLPPDVNRSERDFSVEETGRMRDDGEPERAVRIGISAIKNVGVGVVDAIVASRKGQAGERFVGLAQFCASVGAQVNRRAIECLIKIGAMRDLGNGQQLMLAVESAMAAAQSTRKAAAAGQFGLFGADIPGATDLLDVPLPAVPDWSVKEQLVHEKELLGIYLSEHPLIQVAARARAKQIVNLGTIDEAMAGQRATLIGLLIEPRAMLTKKGTMMLRATLEGVDGVSLDLIAFSEAYERCKEALIADTVVEVDVRVDLRGEQVQLLVEAVRPCADPDPIVSEPQIERRVHISLAVGSSDDLHSRLHDLLRAYPGSDVVLIHCQTPAGRRVLRPMFLRVDGDANLQAAVRGLIGRDAVRFETVTLARPSDYEQFSAD